MNYLLKIIKFDCELERFAEVFGDIIEWEDCQSLSKKFEKIYGRKLPIFPITESPSDEFDKIDSQHMKNLQTLLILSGRENKTELLRAFFRFVNDAYKWEDLEDLGRWLEELEQATGEETRLLTEFSLNPSQFVGEEFRYQILKEFALAIIGRHGARVWADCNQLLSEEVANMEGGF